MKAPAPPGASRPRAFVLPPASLAAKLALAVALDSAVQLIWKAAVKQAPADADWRATLQHTFLNWRFFIALAIFVCQFINWMWILAQADLSYAQPLTALAYVFVTAGARVLYHENLSPRRLAGIALVLAGVALITGTQHRTHEPEKVNP